MADTRKKALVPRLRFPEFRLSAGWELPHGDDLFDAVNNRESSESLPILAITQEHGAIPRDQIDYHVSVTDKSIESYKVVEKGDFIISLRSFQGGIEYSTYRGICSPAYVILRRKGEGSDDYFRHLFKSPRFIQQLTRNIEGLRDGKMISYKQFSEQLIPVPRPDEQLKIASCLTSLDDVSAAQRRKVETLKAYKRGLMQQIFPREGEAFPRRRFPEFRDAPAWVARTLSDIASISSGTTPLRANKEFYDGGTIPWVKTLDLNNAFIESTEECITAKPKATVNPAGSVLVAMYGGFNQIGRTGLLRVPAATNQALSVLRVSDEGLLPIFLLWWLNAKVDDWKRIASSSRKDPNITGSDVAAFRIRFPKPEEQQRIADCLFSVDTLLASEQQKLNALEAHKTGLLQQVLPGPGDA